MKTSTLRDHRPAERGFTLLEVMLALAILAGVVVTLLSSLNYHLGVASDNRDTLIASILARGKVEEMDLMGPPEKEAGGFGEDFPDFSWEVRKIEDTGYEDFERLDLKVMWDDDRELSFITYREKK